MTAVVVLFWLSLALLVWTHAGYPLAVAALARIRPRRVAEGDIEPSVTLIVTAYNEEAMIARRIENLLALDYPEDKLELVVTSDASTDRTEEIALLYPGVRVVTNPKGGKVAAQNRAVRQTDGEIVAFTDANSLWSHDALRQLVRAFADPQVAYVMGRLHLEDSAGGNKEGAYWRYEVWLRRQESLASSVTGGYGAIYAVRRRDYVEVDPRFGHDLALPYLMVQRGRRAVYQATAHAFEEPTPTIGTEYGRKVRMFEHCWLILLRGKMLRRLGPLYTLEIFSHRVLRYGSGVLHVVLLATSVALVTHGWIYDAVLGAQLALLLGALVGVGLARYYVLVSWATNVALVNYLRRGVPASWEPVRE